jgi:hypothetical protein
MYKIKVSDLAEKQEKEIELITKITSYKLAQSKQLEEGGPGPVASFEVMVIVNEHNGNFEVEVEE